MQIVTDQLNNSIQLRNEPLRIVSLVPSQTELIAALGAQAELVGRTKFCIHPTSIKNVTVVGGTKNVNISKVHSLKPNLIIGNKEENVFAQIEALQLHYPVYISDVNTYNDAIEMIANVGVLINKNDAAQQLINQLHTLRLYPSNTPNNAHKPRVAYLMWHNPYMAVGNTTFINAMLYEAGFVNVFEQTPRYPVVTIANLITAQPDFIFLSSEPFPFKQKHIDELQQQLPSVKILLVDGELFSWYGSRLTHSFTYFKNLRNVLGFN